LDVPVYRLGKAIVFPPPQEAERSGLLAVGGDLRPERLLLAYSMGIFPWYQEGEPILWYSPTPRMVLVPQRVHVGRSLRRTLRQHLYRLTLDTAFREVMEACATVPRAGQGGTWITGDMLDAYTELHRLGFAHSIEVWDAAELVGGLYGVSIGASFAGESMFSRRPDASKIAFVRLATQLATWGMDFIDCQLPAPHLERLGCERWRRPKFQRALAEACAKPTRRGRWKLDDLPSEG
jgi:leucyl/phenylalanyl-tRNA--protein transferase